MQTMCTAVVVTSFGSVAIGDSFGVGANQFTIDFVTISGDTNPSVAQVNAGDLDGYGIVNRDYRIGVYEVTNDQWDKFAASYGTEVTGTNSGYGSDSYWTGANVSVNRVSWYEAMQMVNWLNTSTGHAAAYLFRGTQGTGDYYYAEWEPGHSGYDPNYPLRHKDTKYFLPSEHEWVKAAYWNRTAMVIQTYATDGGGPPPEWTPTGGANSDGQAAGWNYGRAYPDNSSFTDQPWDVTAGYSPRELNGTFDMMGNQREWMENEKTRGGAHDIIPIDELASTERQNISGGNAWSRLGFRVAAKAIETVTPGDTDGDDDVDLDDYANLIARLGASPGLDSADFNHDGRVYLEDFVIQRANFGFGVFASSPDPEFMSAVVPEPTTLFILTIGGLTALRKKRRKV